MGVEDDNRLCQKKAGYRPIASAAMNLRSERGNNFGPCGVPTGSDSSQNADDRRDY